MCDYLSRTQRDIQYLSQLMRILVEMIGAARERINISLYEDFIYRYVCRMAVFNLHG